MKPQEIVEMVQGDGALAIFFVIDNNPEAVTMNLNSRGLLENPDPSRQDLFDAITSITDENTFLEVMTVPYNSQQNNYTANLEDYFPKVPLKSGAFLAIAGAVLSASSSLFNWMSSRQQTEQAEIAQQMQAEQLEYQRQLDEKNRVWGIPLNTVVIFAGIIAVVIVVVVIFKRK